MEELVEYEYIDSPDLSQRETEVLGLIVEGMCAKEIAAALFCSKRTVDYHIWRIYAKLGVSNRIRAIRRAVELQVI